ncbi:hypothetical protein JG687_00017089 [Phytophthora cactorum]|uniref:Uncharacterized protein n=1 Tax=Phytophthora cactorum TaxID=29920 RepID=A0A8T1TSD7_9STRA|nr:hypothetical protein PC121_g14921 [Phytophthora cactorum]KAG6945767.1 hypothetical protein JG687_00017089 [Phytophthora cactorum]
MVRTKNTARIMRAIEEKRAQNVTDNSDMVSRDPVVNEDSQTAVDVHPIASAQNTSVLDDIDTVDSKVHATAEEEEKKEVQDSVRSDKYPSECESSEQMSGVSGDSTSSRKRARYDCDDELYYAPRCRYTARTGRNVKST